MFLDKRIRIDWHLFYLVGNYLAKQSFERMSGGYSWVLLGFPASLYVVGPSLDS